MQASNWTVGLTVPVSASKLTSTTVCGEPDSQGPPSLGVSTAVSQNWKFPSWKIQPRRPLTLKALSAQGFIAVSLLIRGSTL